MLGQYWGPLPKHPPGPDKKIGSESEPIHPPTLAELGLDRKRAARDVTFAAIEEDFFGNIISDRRARKDLSISAVYAEVKRELARRSLAGRLSNIGEAQDCEGVFDVLVIDPPWPQEKLWREQPKNEGGWRQKSCSQKSGLQDLPLTLEEWGLEKNRASRDLCFAEIASAEICAKSSP
jgi:hypothetical protein